MDDQTRNGRRAAPKRRAPIAVVSAGARRESPRAALAHDLRNSVAAITMTSKALLLRGGLDLRQRDAVGRIAATARHLGGLVETWLDSKAGRGGSRSR